MQQQMTHSQDQAVSKGKTFGSILMISGCCIGAGMVGLPLVTYTFGFFPSIFVLLISWLFMLSTGLLLLEVALSFKEKVNLSTIAEKTLGKAGKIFVAMLFFFLFFSLLVAYISGVGEILSKTITETLSVPFSKSAGSGLAFCVLSLLLALGTKAVDHFNRASFYLMLIGLFTLIVFGAKHAKIENIQTSGSYIVCLLSLPVVIVSFGYQNLIPSLTAYLDRDKKKIQLSILIGTIIPFVAYFMWEFVFFGVTDLQGISEQLSNGKLGAIEIISSRVSVPILGTIFSFFTFFALITSLITVSLSFYDFVVDRIKIRQSFPVKLGFSMLLLLLPGILSILYPNLFLKGLGLAGGVGAVLLFGVIPVLLAWKHRYHLKSVSEHLLPGGKAVLYALLFLSAAIFALEIFSKFLF